VTATTEVWWDFSNTGFRLAYLSVEGSGIANIYGVVGHKFRLSSDGHLDVTIDGQTSISKIAFYGTTLHSMPEYGSTLALFMLAVSSMVIITLYGGRDRARCDEAPNP